MWPLSRSVNEWIMESYPEGRRRQEGPVDGCLQCGPGWDLVRCSEQTSRSWEVAGCRLQPSQRWKRFGPACSSPSACPDPRESWVWRRCSHCPLERPSGARAIFFIWHPSRESSTKALSAVAAYLDICAVEPIPSPFSRPEFLFSFSVLFFGCFWFF